MIGALAGAAHTVSGCPKAVLRRNSIAGHLHQLEARGDRLWHDRRVIALVRVALRVLADASRFVAPDVFARPARCQAEILFLRRAACADQERGVKPRRADVATGLGIALLSRLVDWHVWLVVVRPETLVRWRPAGFRLLWHLKSCGPQILDGRRSDRLSVSGSVPSNCQTTTHSPRRPHVLVLAISSLGKMAGGPGFRSACHGNLLAAQPLFAITGRA